MEENRFGVFTDFWDGIHPHHLPLMNLMGGGDVESSLNRLDKILKENPRAKIIEDLSLLIKEADWRPQLVFCVSLLKLKEEEILDLKRELWDKLEEYRSWVIPQLAVTAFIVDSNFKEKAKEILKKERPHIHLEGLDSHAILLELSKGYTTYENKSAIAIRWKKRLLELVKEGKIKVEHEIV